MNRPWQRTHVKDLAALSAWFPEAMVAWDAFMEEIECDWPVAFYANGHAVSAEDGRCFSNYHNDNCRCYCWDWGLKCWYRWLPDR